MAGKSILKYYLGQDLMVPLSKDATVSAPSTFLDAMLTLEKAPRAFDHTQYTHRSVLVFGSHTKIVGTLACIDLLSALGSHRQILEKQPELFKFGFSNRLTHQIYRQRHLTADSLRNPCEKAAKFNVEDSCKSQPKGSMGSIIFLCKRPFTN